VYAPYIKQEEPLKTEMQHFLDCIRNGTKPMTDGAQGLDLVRILEASSESLQRSGAAINILPTEQARDARVLQIDRALNGLVTPQGRGNGSNGKGNSSSTSRKVKIRLNAPRV
jgi:hypothetical protein